MNAVLILGLSVPLLELLMEIPGLRLKHEFYLLYLAAFFLINRNSALLSLLVYVVATAVIDHFTDHFEAIKQVTIITKDPAELVKCIKNELNKTCTIMDSYGAISGDNKTLICYINYFELSKMKDIISRNKGTFSTVSTIDEILR